MNSFIIISFVSALIIFSALTVVSAFLFLRDRRKHIDVRIPEIRFNIPEIKSSVDVNISPIDIPEIKSNIELTGLSSIPARDDGSAMAPVPAPPAEVDDTRVQTLTEEKQQLCQQVDRLRGQLSLCSDELRDARAEVEYWQRGGDLRIDLIDDQLKRLSKSVGRGDTNMLTDLLRREKQILELRQFAAEDEKEVINV